MYSKFALPCALIALATAGTGCNLIFGIEPGTEAATSSSSTTASSATATTGSGDGGSAQATSGAGGAGGAGGDAPSCPPSSCTAGECPVTQMPGELGANPKGMAVTGDLVFLANNT